MKELIEQFPQQLKQALQIGKDADLQKNSEISNVLVSGLGGSGIGGNIVGAMIGNDLKVPFQVNKGYDLPSYVNENSLVIISSYSGNTEETLRVMEQALKTGTKIACISSGGKVIELARENGLDHIIVPGGMPPRACLGYSLIQQLFILDANGLLSSSFKSELEKSILLIEENQEIIRSEAKEIAAFLHNKRPILYSADFLEPALIRFRQQLNENSKMLCWHHVVPEMNHNELVGWREKNDHNAVIWWRSKSEFSRVSKRIDLNKGVVSNYTANSREIWNKGDSLIQEYIYAINIGDWVSLYLAELNGFDPMEIDVINQLKKNLQETAW